MSIILCGAICDGEKLAELANTAIIMMPNDRWDEIYSPWPAEGFAGRFDEMYSCVSYMVEPYVNKDKIYICGYSLAGLFALKSFFVSDIFDGAVCCSGSLWYPEWQQRFDDKRTQTGKVYLSIGNRERKGNVKEVTQWQYDYCISNGYDTIYEKNPGGHFSNVEERLAKGIRWMIGEKA